MAHETHDFYRAFPAPCGKDAAALICASAGFPSMAARHAGRPLRHGVQILAEAAPLVRPCSFVSDKPRRKEKLVHALAAPDLPPGPTGGSAPPASAWVQRTRPEGFRGPGPPPRTHLRPSSLAPHGASPDPKAFFGEGPCTAHSSLPKCRRKAPDSSAARLRPKGILPPLSAAWQGRVFAAVKENGVQSLFAARKRATFPLSAGKDRNPSAFREKKGGIF